MKRLSPGALKLLQRIEGGEERLCYKMTEPACWYLSPSLDQVTSSFVRSLERDKLLQIVLDEHHWMVANITDLGRELLDKAKGEQG